MNILWKKILLKYNKFIGNTFYINMNTYEAHSIEDIHTNCHYYLMNNIKFVNEVEFKRLIDMKKIDGCRWCNKKYNKR